MASSLTNKKNPCRSMNFRTQIELPTLLSWCPLYTSFSYRKEISWVVIGGNAIGPNLTQYYNESYSIRVNFTLLARFSQQAVWESTIQYLVQVHMCWPTRRMPWFDWYSPPLSARQYTFKLACDLVGSYPTVWLPKECPATPLAKRYNIPYPTVLGTTCAHCIHEPSRSLAVSCRTQKTFLLQLIDPEAFRALLHY